MKLKVISIIVALVVSVLFSTNVFAHQGRLDSNGGHNCSEKSQAEGFCDGYHYHDFKDVVDSYWAKKEIEYLSYTGIIKGYQDGTFKPNNNVTRLQTATMIVRALKLDTTNRPDPQLADVKKGDYGYDVIATVIAEGIFPRETNFRPYEGLKRGEMAYVLTHSYDLSASYNEQIIDVSEPLLTDVKSLAGSGITKIYSDGTYKPNNIVNRAQFSTFLARVLDESFRVTY